MTCVLYEPLYKQGFSMHINDLRLHYCLKEQVAGGLDFW